MADSESPSLCVCCNEPPRSPRLLRCLHSACTTCLVSVTREDASIQCPGCSAVTILPAGFIGGVQALPVGADSAGHEVPRCDECAEDSHDSSTLMVCEDCQLLLCDAHARSHPLSRATKGHRVAAFEQVDRSEERPPGAGGDIGRAAPAERLSEVRAEKEARCPLHNRPLGLFCKPCQRALCITCGSLSHGHHDVLDVYAVDDVIRSRVRTASQSVLASDVPDLQKAIDDVEQAINEAEDRAQLVSEQVTESCQAVVNFVRELEKQSLNTVEAWLVTESQKLTSQCDELKSTKTNLTRIATFGQTAAKNMSPSRLAQVSECVFESMADARKPLETPKAMDRSTILFEDRRRDVLAHLEDIGVGVVHSTRGVCSVRIKSGPEWRGRDVVMAVELLDEAGELLTHEVIARNMEASVVDPTEHHPPTAIVQTGNGCRTVKFSPRRVGQHTVSFRVGERILRRLTFLVMENLLDTRHCSPSVRISTDGLTAVQREPGSGYALGRSKLSPGEEWICELSAGGRDEMQLYFGVSKKPLPEAYAVDASFSQCGADVWFWSSRSGYKCSKGHWEYSEGLPECVKGDHVELRVSSDGSSVYSKHCRTGQTSRLTGITGDVFLYVGMKSSQGQSITVLPKLSC